MQLIAHAKINWALSVTGLREDGYHDVDMVLQSVELGDTIKIQKADELQLLLQGRKNIPDNEQNLALKAAVLLKGLYGVRMGAEIHLRKRIPIGAGLGGGSADAAAVLYGLNQLWELQIDEPTLKRIGLRIGADVPFCLQGGLAHVRGIGEIIDSYPAHVRLPVLIVQPCKGLSTPTVFRTYDTLPKRDRPPVCSVIEAVAAGNKPSLAASMHNALHAAAIGLRPEIAICVQTMEHFGALRAQMTGSGSAVIGLFENTQALNSAYAACSRIWQRCFATHTISSGITPF